MLAAADDKLTRRDILAGWPGGHDPPTPSGLWRWLDRAVTAGLLRRDGGGRRADPFRYWLAQKEAVWRADPLWVLR